MNNRFRQLVLLLIDIVLVNLAVYVMLLLRFDAQIPTPFLQAFIKLIPLFALVTIAFLTGLKLYKRVWEYASISELLAIVQATTYSMAVVVMVIYLFDLPKLPRSVYIGSWVLMNVFIGASRVWWRLFRSFIFNGNSGDFRRVLVIGAGDAGSILIKEIKNNPLLKMKVVGVVDDDKSKQGLIIHGVPILGTRKDIEQVTQQLLIDEIIIAIPSAPGDLIRDIMKICWKTTARLRILPGIYQSAQGLVRNIRDIRMEDLLRRKPVVTDLHEISGCIRGKTVLVTGGGGSIGSELCRQLMQYKPKQLLIIDCSENNLFEIENELKNEYKDISICSILVDVRNEIKLNSVFHNYQPQMVFHAAAYKHVPMMERHPDEAIENNVFGTRNVAVLSDKYGVEVFIYISTDKAVNPTSIMGATKRVSEVLIRNLNYQSKTRYASVRFGNVLGSRGSVIPTFIRQIEQGGPITVTHPDMKRFFMTIPEAVQLVIQASSIAEGGEIFLLDMGEMVRIDDLARDLIRLAGHEPDRDIQIIYTGIRPGEKLCEELYYKYEKMKKTRHEMIWICDQSESQDNDIISLIDELIPNNSIIFHTGIGDTKLFLQKIISEFERRDAV